MRDVNETKKTPAATWAAGRKQLLLDPELAEHLDRLAEAVGTSRRRLVQDVLWANAAEEAARRLEKMQSRLKKAATMGGTA